MMLVLLALVLLIGLYPQPLLDTTAGMSGRVVELFASGVQSLAATAGEVR